MCVQLSQYPISARRELIGLGAANLVGCFFKCMPVTGGFSRSAVAMDGPSDFARCPIHPSMATPVKGGIPPMSPCAGNAVHPVTLNTGTMPRDVLVAIRQRRRHDLPNKVSVCCFPITWDEAYEFTAPKPRQWWRRWLMWLGCSVNDYGGTMFEVIDGLYEEGKINRTQMSQLEALVR